MSFSQADAIEGCWPLGCGRIPLFWDREQVGEHGNQSVPAFFMSRCVRRADGLLRRQRKSLNLFCSNFFCPH